MVDFVPKDLHDIEAHRKLFPRAHLHISGYIYITFLLFKVDRLRRRAECLARARFDFAQHERLPFPRNDVSLAERCFIIDLDDTQSCLFQIFYRPLFSASAKSFFTNVLR